MFLSTLWTNIISSNVNRMFIKCYLVFKNILKTLAQNVYNLRFKKQCLD